MDHETKRMQKIKRKLKKSKSNQNINCRKIMSMVSIRLKGRDDGIENLNLKVLIYLLYY